MKTIFEILDEFHDQHCWQEIDRKKYDVTCNRKTFESVNQMIKNEFPQFLKSIKIHNVNMFMIHHKNHDFMFVVDNEINDGTVCFIKLHEYDHRVDEYILFHNLKLIV